jgi:hypothetical protein
MSIRHAIYCTILYSLQNGVQLDSSYRHKNQNGAPMTLLSVVNFDWHMMPGEHF